MHTKERHYVHQILRVQRSAVELVFVAVILAFGVNIASSSLPTVLNLTNATALAGGIGLCVLSFVYGARRLSSSLSMSIELQGLLLLGNANQIIKVDRYRFSESASSYLQGLAAENKALGTSWKKASLGLCFDGRSDSTQRHTEIGYRLVNEAIEYFVLDELSLHLSEYFDSERDVPDDAVERIKRRDIPQILMDNRFLEQFSKPMSEREAFQHHHDGDTENVVSAWGNNGELFDQFELILPKGSSLSRDNDALQIRTSRYTLRIATQYLGFAMNLPEDFEEFYLGVPFNTYLPQQVDLELSVTFAWWALLIPGGWDHYEWLDSFVENLEHAFSFDNFIQEIGWQTAHSVAIAVRSASKSRKNAG